MLNQDTMVKFIEPPILPHEPECIMDAHELLTRHHVQHQVLVKWKDYPNKEATWESVSTLKKRFPTILF